MNDTPSQAPNHVRLVDTPDGPDRTTATLLASLQARLMTLYVVSGADAIGSLVAGFAQLGREVSRTVEGARLRKALEAGRPGINGDTLWAKLRISDWTSSIPASPILDQLRNDTALLLAEDLEAAFDLKSMPPRMAGVSGSKLIELVTFVDCVLGLWAFSTELAHLVEALAAPFLESSLDSDEVVITPHPGPEPENTLLR